MQTRKIYRSGGSTYIMSLPKKWVEKVGLREGDSVFLREQEGTITVEAREREGEPREVAIRTSRVKGPQALERLLISYYLIWYDTLKIILDQEDYLRYRKIARRLSALLVGVEIVEDTTEAITLEILLDERKMPTLRTLRRLQLIVDSMLSELMHAFEYGEEALAKDVFIREKEVDRLYFLVVRQLKGAVRHQQLAERLGIANQRDALGYRMVVKSLERMADHCENIAQLYLQMGDVNAEELAGLVEFMKIVRGVYQKASSSFFALEADSAQQVFADMVKVEELHKDVLNTLFEGSKRAGRTVLLKGIADSLNRIVGYSSDVAEITINMSVDVP